jgi:crotonobetainyl-CoA:carnitine CoA-transferase CaiB-like acyl-CoA transferase
MSAKALSGLRIVEYGQLLSAPWAGRILSDLGAEVIKVEPPGGDIAREWGPFRDGVTDPEQSGLFLFLNSGKKSVVLDLDDAGDRGRFRALCAGADALIHNLPPADSARLGVRYESLREVNRGLVVCGITRFGLTGPNKHYRGEEITSMHGGGWGWLTPGHLEDPALPPLKVYGHQGDIQAGNSAAFAVLAALFGARQDGCGGQEIDISVQEVLSDNKFNTGTIAYLMTGSVPDRFGEPPFGPSGAFECSDGSVFILCVEDHHWQSLVKKMGEPEWSTWEVFSTPLMRGSNNDVLRPFIAEWTKSRTVLEVYRTLQQTRVPAAPLFDVEGVLNYEHFAARGFFSDVEHPRAGKLRQPGWPYKFSRSLLETPGGAPLLGEHSGELAPRKPAARARLSPRAASSSRLILDGVRVLDLTAFWAGPVSTKEFTRLGADVIRIESHRRTSVTRRGGGAHGIVTAYTTPAGHHHGKRSIMLDLKDPRGSELGRQLAASCDVVVENFAVGVVDRLGLGYEEIARRNPPVIMVSASGYGRTGPDRDYVSFGRPQSYISGLISMTGYQGGGPRELGIPYGDPNAGQFIAIAAMAALHHRRITGEGQHVDLSQQEALALCGFEGLIEYVMTGHKPERIGNHHLRMSPHNLYPCAGDDCWITIACASDEEWIQLAKAIGDRRLLGVEFEKAADRKAREQELDAAIAAWTARKDRFELTRDLQARGIAGFPVMTGEDLAEDEHLRARGYLLVNEDAEPRSRYVMGHPWKLTGARDPRDLVPPDPGEHTREILAELGVPAGSIDELYAAEVVA